MLNYREKKLSVHNYSIVILNGIVSSQGIKVIRRTGMLVLRVLYKWVEDENSVIGSVSIGSVISCGCSARSVISIVPHAARCTVKVVLLSLM